MDQSTQEEKELIGFVVANDAEQVDASAFEVIGSRSLCTWRGRGPSRAPNGKRPGTVFTIEFLVRFKFNTMQAALDRGPARNRRLIYICF